MGRLVKIFVEGIADKKFLLDYINHLPNISCEAKQIIEISGWTNLNSELIRVELQKNTDNGGINLLVFDADTDPEERRKEIEAWKSGCEFELFLLPNNQDQGALESLLEKIIAPENKPIFDCWDKYEACLVGKSIDGRDEPLTLPAKKTKIYGYLEALLGPAKNEKEKIKERKRDYTNQTHWNLDDPYLNPLKEFLRTNFLSSD